MTFELVVGPQEEGLRLDRFMAARLEDSSRSLIQKHIESGAVTVDGAPPKRGTKTAVRRGNVVRYTPPPPEPTHLVAEDIPLAILHEDADLLVIDKPRGLVVHPAVGHRRGTLVNAILHHVQGLDASVAQGDLRPGIVHRLDRDTTGAMVVAKNADTQRKLVRAFQSREVKKTYLAVVHGVPAKAEATIDTLYGRHPRDRKRFTTKVREGKRAVTRYAVAERFPGAALLKIDLETGRTHQIRVHMAEAGHPLIGDAAYGARRRGAVPFDRPALHAARLELTHPRSEERMVFDAPIPGDFAALMEALRRLRS